jgi:polyphosphate kinase 2
MRYVLSKFEYTNKDYDVVGEPDGNIVKRGRDQIGD